MSKTTLKIGGMSCGHCVAAVKEALTAVPGLTDLDVKVGEASFGGSADVEQAKKAVEEEGYTVLTVSRA
ncbi:MAG TPA: heavy-metal-associated domain-containing protein [Symbiobacteriaceae bacterium]|nr:heavy-metal-associated domain-containing protein [Symbiobacteriaceae bacterium]